MARLLILGASQGIGRATVQRALDRGHEVRGFSRTAAAMDIEDDGFHALSGDILNREDVERAVSGQDAVVWAIGCRPTRKQVTLFSEGVTHLIDTMMRERIARLVCVTGIGAGDSAGHGGFFYDQVVQPLLLKSMYDDKNEQEQIVMASSLYWTIVRPGFLTNGPMTGSYRVLTDVEGETAGKISRKDVAHFIVDELETGDYLGAAAHIWS